MTDKKRTGIVASSVVVAAVVALTACGNVDAKKTAFDSGMARPDSYPVMLNKDMPFRYPPALYAEKVQGNVTLRLYVDRDGGVVDDSTRVVESSKITMLDSAAIKGARELKFVPAKLRGAPMPVSILFPVYFRHPEVAPPAGDTVLHKVPVPSADSTSSSSARGTTKDTTKGTTKDVTKDVTRPASKSGTQASTRGKKMK